MEDSDIAHVHNDDRTHLEPPPSYEQSVSASIHPHSIDSTSPPSELSQLKGKTSGQPDELQLDPVPRPPLRHQPSAPPLGLSAVDSEQYNAAHDETHWNHRRYITMDDSVLRSRHLAKDHRQDTMSDTDETAVFGDQQAESPSNQPQEHGRVGSEAALGAHLKTQHRLDHKQALTRNAASAPDLHPHHRAWTTTTPRQPSSLQLPVPIFPPEIPAPPPRSLHFRSRDASPVPACPYPLCQKPIALTKTRRERGVTVWIACALLFFLNTYWTTQLVMSFFSIGPYQDRYHRQRMAVEETLSASSSAGEGFSFQREAIYWIRGLLGFKAERQTFSSMLKPSGVAAMGAMREEQGLLKMLLGFFMMATTAIIRWWLCLTPLLVRPLFDTVHSCPHPHPYPYPEELEHERMQMEKELREQLEEIKKTHGGSTQTPSKEVSTGKKETTSKHKSKSEKKKLALDQAENQDESQVSPTEVPESESGSTPGSTPPEVDMTEIYHPWEYKKHQRHQALNAVVGHVKKKQLSWRARRALRKAEEKRLQIVKATQDIGRYSLLYELGASLVMDRWKQAILAGDIQPEAYED